MVDESVPGRPHRSRLALVLATLVFASSSSAFADDGAPLVIDLDSATAKERASRRARITAALGQHPVLSASIDGELSAALIGELPLVAATRGTEAAEAAHEGAKSGRCVEALASAQIALLDLAGAQAAGARLEAPIRLAYAARLRCELKKADQAAAMATAQTLRRLGQRDAPAGIDKDAWALLPELDASANVTMAEVAITSEPDGAQIWIDHEARGVAPLTVHLKQGSHLVAAAAAGGALSAKTIEVTSWSHREAMTPKPSVGRWTKINELVIALRAKRRGADATAIGELISIAGASSALVLLPGGTTEVWRVIGDRTVRVGQRRSEAQAVALLGGAGGTRAPDPNLPLLRETEAERAARAKKVRDKPKWWVYAAVIGAAAVGAGVIVFGQSGTDRQRFEITLP